MKRFSDWDVYYLCEYAYSFKLHGDGEPLLFYYTDEDMQLCYVVMKADIAMDKRFDGVIECGKWFDLETPYGYGGPLVDGNVSEKSQRLFLSELSTYCKNNRIVSQFIRFHPLLDNATKLPLVFETRYLRDTIYIDTSAKDLILKNMDSKNRNMVRKAQKNGVSIVCKSIEEYLPFKDLYAETMQKDNAEEYYIFNDDYFNAQNAMKDNSCIFYAMRENRPVAGAIIYYNDRFAHYHLAGSHTEDRKYAPSNLLLYEVACWASEKGIKSFHLGGGMAPDDNLFGFKKQFNKLGRLPFYVGRTIFDRDGYNYLLNIRKKSDLLFEKNNKRMIQYRA